MALYGTFRSQGAGYFLGKIGILKEDLEASVSGISIDADDTGLSYGFGAGYNFNKQIGVEAEYTIVEEDVSLIAATVRFMF